VLIESFSLAVTAKALPANVNWKSAFLNGVVNAIKCQSKAKKSNKKFQKIKRGGKNTIP